MKNKGTNEMESLIFWICMLTHIEKPELVKVLKNLWRTCVHTNTSKKGDDIHDNSTWFLCKCEYYGIKIPVFNLILKQD